MTRIRRRQGNRRAVPKDTPVVAMVRNQRLQGSVLDATEFGIGTHFPRESGMAIGQQIKIIYQRQLQKAKVLRVTPATEVDHVVLKFIA